LAQDPRIDAYIAKAAPFAQPILTHLRELVHAAVPRLEETIKWGMPHFVHNGKNLAGLAAFKAHTAFVIHGEGRQGDAMGQYGKIASLEDLPDAAELTAKLRAAAAAIDQAGSAPKRKSVAKAPKSAVPMPDDLAAALAATAGLRAIFDGFPPGAQREYLEWIVAAKRPETRARRIVTTCDQVAAGKKLNWRYEAC
jgi:uncharacterized protein YdeI (YjbR/CyaY-like superfamily)